MSIAMPPSIQVTSKERWRAIVGATLRLMITFLLMHGWAHWIHPSEELLAFVAPMGATALIVFALPSSPLAQPWAVLGGNTLSALVGLMFAYWVPEPQWACGLAVGAAMVVMFGARCLHPPGGAIALLTALHHTTNPLMAILPILLNSIVLVAVAVVYNSRTGRPYPHVTAALPRENIEHGPRFSKSDLDAALVRYNEVIDIDRDDLESLFYEAEALAWERTLGELRCHQVMSKNVITVHQKDNLAQAREQLYKHAVKALPVIDVTRRVVGIVTMADLFTRTAGYGNTRSNTTGDDPHGGGRVEDVMTRQVRVASDTNRVMDLLPLFSEGGTTICPSSMPTSSWSA